MNKRYHIVVFLFCLFLAGPVQGLMAQVSEDFMRLSERTIMGTARYVGMGGAMSAIGGDPSAVLDNPAGLGLYRRTEVLVTFDETLDRTRQITTGAKGWLNYFTVPQASLVFSVPSYTNYTKGVLFNNFMVAYHRIHSYNRTWYATGASDRSFGALMGEKGVQLRNFTYPTDPIHATSELEIAERGYVNEFTFDWSMNISNQWYVGAGVHVQSHHFTSDGTYYESFDRKSSNGKAYDIENKTGLLLTNASCNLSLGLLCRPTQWLRLGISMQTPSVGTIRTRTSGSISAQTDSLRSVPVYSTGDATNDFHMPWHSSVSAAFQIGAYGMVALQYDYRHGTRIPDVHSLRAGIEVVPVLGLYINAGYAYESSFRNAQPSAMDASFERQDTYSFRPLRTQYASCAVGYRGQHIIVQAAYQFRWQNVNLYAHEQTKPYAILTNAHQIVLTIGWHRG